MSDEHTKELERETICGNCRNLLYQNANPNNIHWYHVGTGDVRCPTTFAEPISRASVAAPQGIAELLDAALIHPESAEIYIRQAIEMLSSPVSPSPTPEQNSFTDFLPIDAVRIAPGEYEVKARDGRVLWRMEGAALADWVCASVNGYDAALSAFTEKCERCDGTGEVEGYGGNNVYCGHCAGKGRKPIFFTPPSTTPSARVAAEEIRNYVDGLICAPPMRDFERDEIERILLRHFPSAQPVEEQKIGHAKNPDAFCLVCNQHPCELIAAATADNDGEDYGPLKLATMLSRPGNGEFAPTVSLLFETDEDAEAAFSLLTRLRGEGDQTIG